ncbi:molybdate ABC transporter substrate-binding protein [Chloroflexota bacterium]
MQQNNLKRSILSLLSLALTLTFANGCSSPGADIKLSVFASAGAKTAIDEICEQFTERYGTEIEIHYGGGGEVLSRMILAKSGDIYIAPEQRFMDSAREKQAIDPGTIKSLAYTIPVIAVSRGNPKQIKCLSDLAKPGVRVAITRSETTLLGKFAPEIFAKAGLSTAIEKNTVTTASDPNNLLTMLIMGSIDAGITWNFYETSASDKVEVIWLSPEQLTGIGQIQAAISTYSENNRTAIKLMEFLISPQSKDVFKKCGYITDSREVKKYWK